MAVAQPGHDGRVAQGRRGSAGAFDCLAVPRQDRVAAPRCIFWWHTWNTMGYVIPNVFVSWPKTRKQIKCSSKTSISGKHFL